MPADVARARSPSTSDQIDRSGASAMVSDVSVPGPLSASNGTATASPPVGSSVASPVRGFATTRPDGPARATATPAPRLGISCGGPRRSSEESIERTSAAASSTTNAEPAPSATNRSSPKTPRSRLASGRPPNPSTSTTRPVGSCTTHRVARDDVASTAGIPSAPRTKTSPARAIETATTDATDCRHVTVSSVCPNAMVRPSYLTLSTETLSAKCATKPSSACLCPKRPPSVRVHVAAPSRPFFDTFGGELERFSRNSFLRPRSTRRVPLGSVMSS